MREERRITRCLQAFSKSRWRLPGPEHLPASAGCPALTRRSHRRLKTITRNRSLASNWRRLRNTRRKVSAKPSSCHQGGEQPGVRRPPGRVRRTPRRRSLQGWLGRYVRRWLGWTLGGMAVHTKNPPKRGLLMTRLSRSVCVCRSRGRPGLARVVRLYVVPGLRDIPSSTHPANNLYSRLGGQDHYSTPRSRWM